MSGKVYILEDDEAISGLVKVSLEMHGIECKAFSDVKSFYEGTAEDMPDVVLLDVMLPDGNGLDVMKKLKAGSPKLSCLILSALGQEADRIKGLDCGADDYISKPFSTLELVARVKAALRRQTGSAVLRSGGLELDTESMQVRLDGEAVELNRKEYELLKQLLFNEGKVLTRNDLLDKVWGYGGAETRTLDNHIARLRKAGIVSIETVFGVGYRLKAVPDEA